MNRAGRLVVVLTSIPIYLMMACYLPKWVIKTIDGNGQGLLWKDQEHVNGGNCLVASTLGGEFACQLSMVTQALAIQLINVTSSNEVVVVAKKMIQVSLGQVCRLRFIPMPKPCFPCPQ